MNELPLGSLPRISSIPGPRGPKGDPGTPGSNGTNGISPQATTTASFVMPAAAAQVTVAVDGTSWTAVGQPIYIETAGSFTVTTILSSTSLRLTAQTATGNAVAGTTITAGKKVVPGAQMTTDASVTNALGNRITALESTPQGNRSWYANTQPPNTGGQLRIGDIWFDVAHGYKMYRWDGSTWVNVQRVLDLPDFGTGIRPIVKVATLPDASTYSNGDFVWNQTDGKLYRLVAGVWTKAIATGDLVGQIDGTMIVDGTLVAQKLAANSVTADKVGANQIITQSANIGNGVITDANISTLSAGKITAGDIQTVNIGYAGGVFHPSYITGAYAGRYFRTTEFGTSFADNFNFGTGNTFSFTLPTPVIAYGPGNASWRLNNAPAMCPTSSGQLLIQAQGRLIGYSGNICIFGKVNGGSPFALAGRNSQDGNAAIIDCNRILTGLTPADRVQIYVAPCDGNGNLAASVTCRYELDVVFFNW